MNSKKNKIILILGLIIIIMFIVIKVFVKSNEEFGGAVISGSIGALNLDKNENISKEDEEYIIRVCFTKRKNGIDINSENARKLGKPTNTMSLFLYNKIEGVSSRVHRYNLWIGNKIGYIQNIKDNKVYILSSDENKFFIDQYLKFHSIEEVKSMISNEF
ncbi:MULTISPECIES: hypothetical protein [Romboutsia]|uniref:Uncharacterized protein n=1 Tax=Romboutsia hominis TaxID=1507512 RepID=A0A2P2BQB3_9FIRM|nr:MULTISPECIES: hypothetical protein [Romboutsia]MCH1959827.1 hypothetical protein [Romboutsia hominis]MCH1969750.1 hypothetical protein [Romboutsia hominis]MDB8792583.1 hypothetical protein [Romboutsia sp. 1001216sp1]MDB8796250.1 hypothetical protein [Romboutsia sp. 1001216sp1]MDB8798243.1 hypothetical protein [Romboutsia sp. 1001216sp1]